MTSIHTERLTSSHVASFHASPSTVRQPLLGGARGDIPALSSDSISLGKPSYLTKGTILTHKNKNGLIDVLFIDHAPPDSIRGPLAYLFHGGFSSLEYDDRMLAEVEKRRAELAVFNRAENQEGGKPLLPESLKNLLKGVDAKTQAAKGAPFKEYPPAKDLVEFYAYNEAALRRQGWNGVIPASPKVNTWDQLCDWELKYPNALSNNVAKRKLGAFYGRPLLYFKGLFTTANQPHVQGLKGGRTLWTSVPIQITIGLVIASLAVTGTQVVAHKHEHAENP